MNCLFEHKAMSVSDEYLQNEIYNQLLSQSRINDMTFAATIRSLPRREQFVFTMERWAQQVHIAEMYLESLHSGGEVVDRSGGRVPIGSYIHSAKSGKYYLNLGVEIKTLQGCIYMAHEYSDAFIDEVSATGTGTGSDFSKLTALAIAPTAAIKYYDKKCCDLGVTLSGLIVKEKAVQEIAMTKSIYPTAKCNEKLNQPLLPWLPEPYKNVIKLIEDWEDTQRKCYFMVTEFANCGELLLFIDSYHSIIYRDKKLNIERIDEIQNGALREVMIRNYRDSIRTSADGANAYIELVRFLFQQMVQAIFTLHCQGIAHLDISPENFVLHFDENGQLLAKLIDFGRATKVELKTCTNEQNKYEYEFEKYDFSVSTYPGKPRYMSPESALFLEDKEAEAYDASKQDIYALGVVLYVLLTCTLPYNAPFYIERETNESNENIGYLNGNKKYKIDLKTMTYVASGEAVNVLEHDPTLGFLQKYGVTKLLYQNCHLDYVSNDALDLLNTIFTKRLGLKQLIAHPFVRKPPNPQLLMAMIQHVVDYKGLEYADQQKRIAINTHQINMLHQNRLKIQAQYITNQIRIKNPPPILQNEEEKSEKKEKEIAIIEPPIAKPKPKPKAKAVAKPGPPASSSISISLSTSSSSSPLSESKSSCIVWHHHHIAHSVASPSPPPQPNYECSPSPVFVSFSPSPEAPSPSPNLSCGSGTYEASASDDDHDSEINCILKTHFHFNPSSYL